VVDRLESIDDDDKQNGMSYPKLSRRSKDFREGSSTVFRLSVVSYSYLER
jgi:hypothetical protein